MTTRDLRLHWAWAGRTYTFCGRSVIKLRVQRCTPQEAIHAVWSSADCCADCQDYAPLRVIDMKEAGL